MLLRTHRFSLPSTDTLANVQREMENLFGRVLTDSSDASAAARGWRAPLAMWSDNDRVYFEIEVPGVAKESVDLTIHNGVMRVSGERKRPEEERNYWVNDRVYGTFDRSISLPEDVDVDSVEARLTDGVLQITLSKKPECATEKDCPEGLAIVAVRFRGIRPGTRSTNLDHSSRSISRRNSSSDIPSLVQRKQSSP